MVAERNKFLHPASNQTLDDPAQNPASVLTTLLQLLIKPTTKSVQVQAP
jgi:hypothetical protein